MRRVRLIAGLAAAGLLMAACGGTVSDKHKIVEPVTIDDYSDEVQKLTLTEKAVERLDIQTTAVVEQGEFLVVPSAAIVVDATGTFWLYTNPEPLVYLRHQIELAHEDDGQAFLTGGPVVGTAVVIVGVPELYGAETGIGK
ncbi:MAG: hypothetical protein ACT4OP_13405 [Actinomycetota bacterium]